MTSNLVPTYAPPKLVFERGEGVYLYDKDDKPWLDFIAGIAVNALGHSNPKLIEALNTQAGKLWHLSNMFEVPDREALAARYCEATFADLVFFTNSGSEAIEGLLKAARRFHFDNGQPERIEILTFQGAFHGRSYGAINAGGNPVYLKGFGPTMEGFKQLPFADDEAFIAAITNNTAAVLIEPVQGEGGIRAVPEEFLRLLRAKCDETGALLLYDEIQCGFGRTGKLFAHQWTEAEPDGMAVAKGVGGGFPLGAFLLTQAVGEHMVVGTHGSTYGGNPLAMAVGIAAWDEVSKPEFLQNVVEVGNFLKQQLAGLADAYKDVVVESRGKGLLVGLKLHDQFVAREVAGLARDQGLLIGAAGDNVIRMAPPLIVSQAHVREAIGKLEKTLQQARDNVSA
ncbi:Acetylornithine aminotransferase [hydrothermal vent metagenome]|uniref:Acetylornithine aminotransferase n=1 Tax=hydrothermal vent metagenome TaxID=652676 RepID=A0A3B0RNV0_9ZZZZ